MTALLLPTDGCPRCVAGPVHPYKVDQLDVLGFGPLTAWYECPSCGLRWRTGWSADALNLPCPGCPDCNPERRTA